MKTAPLTLEDLLKPGVRWRARQKAALLAAIDSGQVSERSAMAMWEMSPAELAEMRAFCARWEQRPKRRRRRKDSEATLPGVFEHPP